MSENKENGSGAERAEGFQFPGRFEITAIGPTGSDLEQLVPVLLEDAGLEIDRESLRARASSQGNYLAVTIGFQCNSRDEYEAAHHALRASEHVRYTH